MMRTKFRSYAEEGRRGEFTGGLEIPYVEVSEGDSEEPLLECPNISNCSMYDHFISEEDDLELAQRCENLRKWGLCPDNPNCTLQPLELPE